MLHLSLQNTKKKPFHPSPTNQPQLHHTTHTQFLSICLVLYCTIAMYFLSFCILRAICLFCYSGSQAQMAVFTTFAIDVTILGSSLRCHPCPQAPIYVIIIIHPQSHLSVYYGGYYHQKAKQRTYRLTGHNPHYGSSGYSINSGRTFWSNSSELSSPREVVACLSVVPSW